MNFDVPERANYSCYKLNGITYLPHYDIPAMYVGPSKRIESGFIKAHYESVKFFKNELIRLGAVEVKEQLWTTHARNQK